MLEGLLNRYRDYNLTGRNLHHAGHSFPDQSLVSRCDAAPRSLAQHPM